MKKAAPDRLDKLARAVANGFARTAKDIATIREEMATKKELGALRLEMKEDLRVLRSDIDLLLDRHIGTFRKDYDELATRVKKLEEIVSKLK